MRDIITKLETLNEDLGDMAREAEKDHEVQMARADLYKSAKYAVAIHKMLKDVSEMEGIDGWVAAKITKAADYLGSVKHYMEGEMMADVELAVVPVAGDMTDAMTMPQESEDEQANEETEIAVESAEVETEATKDTSEDQHLGEEQVEEEDVIGDIIAKLPKQPTRKTGYSQADRDIMNKLIAKVDSKTAKPDTKPMSAAAKMSPVTQQKQANAAAKMQTQSKFSEWSKK